MGRTIYTGLGANEDVTVDIGSGSVDISDATIEVAVGSYTAPGAWQTPDNITYLDDFSAKASLTIGNLHYNPVAGRYWMWWRVSVAGKVIISPVRSASFTVTDVNGVSTGVPFGFYLYDNLDGTSTLSVGGGFFVTDNIDGTDSVVMSDPFSWVDLGDGTDELVAA